MNNPAELLFEASKAVGEYFKTKRCLFNEIDLEQNLEIVHRDYFARGVKSVAGKHKLSNYSPAASAEMQAGRTVVNADSKIDPRTAKLYKKTYEPAGERSYVAVPLMHDGQWKASLWISDDKPRSWSNAEIALLEVVAERVWLAVEKQRSDQAVSESEERYRTLFASAPMAVFVCDRDAVIQNYNEHAVRLWGRTPTCGVEKHCGSMKLWLPNGDLLPHTHSPMLEVLRTGIPVFNVEVFIEQPSGARLPVLVNFAALKNQKGEITGAITSFSDITDRKRAEERLRESEQNFRAVFTQTSAGIAQTDLTGGFVLVNDRYCEIVGRTRPELMKMRMQDVTHPDDLPVNLKHFGALLKGEKSNFDIEKRYVRPDGAEVWVHNHVSAIRDAKGSAIQIVAAVTDITERKKAVEALRESEESYRVLTESASDAIISIDENSMIAFVNSAATRTFGYPEEEMTGQSLTMLMPENLRSAHRAGFSRYLDTGVRKLNWESVQIPAQHKDGHEFPLEISFGEYSRYGNRFFIGVARDITERKKAIEDLRESEARRQLAQDAGNIGIFDWDITADKTYWSETMWSFYGEEASDINPDDAYWSSHIHEHDRERVRRNLRRIVESDGVEFRDEYRIIRSDGTIRWIEAKARVSRDESGKATRMYGVNNDITSRKEAEEKIRASDTQLRLVTSSVPALISYVDKDERYRFANERFTDWFGIPTHEVIGKQPRDIFGPVAYEVIKPWIDRALSGEKCTFETVLNNKNDGEKFVSASFIPDIGADGTVYGYYGLTHDLTDLKRSEEENTALVAQLREREVAENQRIELLGRLVASQETERRRFARDLHDQMGQRLTALRLKIASLHELAPGDDQFTTHVDRLQEIAERIDSEVSFLAWELRPAALDDLGLVDAIAAFVNEWSRHHEVAADFHSAGHAKKRLDPEAETHLYRITQEALNNIAKHAEAKHVSVMLERREQNAILIVEDDGKGFDVGKKRIASESGSGLGLLGMGERAVLAGGEIEIESDVGKGTTIFIRVPFSE
ncbi:MAG: PAS domain S-box protein [Pyrinomonadaceae bacterium]